MIVERRLNSSKLNMRRPKLTTANVCVSGAAVRVGGQLHHHRGSFRSLGKTPELRLRLQHEQELQFKREMGVEDEKRTSATVDTRT